MKRGLALLIGALVSTTLLAQSFQTSFAEQKYDRAAGAGTLHGGVDVDGASGALNMRLPMGPGIGARGAVFRPELSLRWAPQVTTVVHTETGPSGDTYWAESISGEAMATLSPGSLDLRIFDYPGPQFVENYEVSGGGSGVTHPRAGQIPSPAPDTAAILAAFGYSDCAVTLNPHQEPQNPALPQAQPFVRVTSDGGLLLGISSSTSPLLTKSMGIGGDPVQFRNFQFPSRLLLVKGEFAYEVSFADYRESLFVPMGPTAKPPYSVYQPHFRLTRICNRVGESIAFTYSDGGTPSYSATWMKDGVPTGASLRVAYTSARTTTGTASISVTYTGASEGNPSYTLAVREVALPAGQLSGIADDAWTRLRPLSLTQDYSGERIQWNYVEGERVGYNTWVPAPQIIESIQFPGRSVSMVWKPYKYVRNKAPQECTSFVADNIAWAYGVTQVTEQSMSGGSPDGPSRVTSHARTVPLRAENVATGTKPGTWASSWTQTTFRNVIRRPDGIVVVNTYAGPGGPVDPASTLAGGLLFLKHALLEERHYTPSQYVENESASAETSVAFKRVRYSGWDIRCAANPMGVSSASSLPYPTITETWETREGDGIYQKATLSNWDTAGYGWSTTTTTWSLNGSLQSTQTIQRSYESDTTVWFLKRQTREQTTFTSDTTGSMAQGVTFPTSLPAALSTFDGVVNTPLTKGVGDPSDPLTLTTTYTYGVYGAEKLLPTTLTLSGDGLQSGLVGIGASDGSAGYLYDALGRLRSIQQRGVSWCVQQTTDAFGRVKTQTNANGNTVTYGYDDAGRLRSIQPDGEQGTTLEYNDTDHRGVRVVRGAQWTEYRYNGFGELILERRTNGAMTSYRLFGYNAKGQRTGETVWMSERAATANEAWWSSANLTQPSTTTVPGTTRCAVWTLDQDGNAFCSRWTTTPPTTVTTPSLCAGTAITYDERGRVVRVVNPNGERTETQYSGLTLQRTVHARVKGAATPSALATTLTRDVLERLVKVVDPKGQTTTYAYDPAGRILRSQQTDPGSGVTQARNWAYDHLGRLVILDQPESGVTYYAGFTITGKPTRTIYGLPRGWRPANLNQEDSSAASVAGVKVVTSGFDLTGRPLSVSGPGVSQGFAYDNIEGATQANGKVRRAVDGAVALDYTYGGLGGRLSRLDTTVPGRSAAITQSFGYDTYGNRIQATTPNGSTDLTINPASGLVTMVRRNQSVLVAVPTWDEASWQPLSLSFGSGASTAFGYRADQASLSTLKHMEAGGIQKMAWTYQYDEAGRLLQDGEDQYQYDELGRLWKATVARLNGAGTVEQSFEYDAFGNATSSVATGALPPEAMPGFNLNNFTFSAAERLTMAQTNKLPTMASGAPTGAQYDPQGNLLTLQKMAGSGRGMLTMTYDGLGRVVSVLDGQKQVKEVYQYTPEGLRIVVQEFAGSDGYVTPQKTRVNLYNDQRQLVSQYTLSGGSLTWKRDFVYLGSRELAEFDGVGMHVTHVDHLGSPRMVTNASGKSEGVQKYLPFGETLDQIGVMPGKGFTNHEQSDGSGLIYMQARFYAPQWHRFLSPDPARDQHFEQTQSWNITSYVQNTPTMSIDPTGMFTKDRNLPNESLEAGGVEVQGGGSYYSSLDEQNDEKEKIEKLDPDRKLLKAWATEKDPVAASLLVSSYNSKGVFGVIGEGATPGHVVVSDPTSGLVLLSQYPPDGKPIGENSHRNAIATVEHHNGAPPNNFLVDIKDRGAFARQALAEKDKKLWTPMGIFGTQCAVSSTRSLFAGGSYAVDRTPFRWPNSLTRRLDVLAGVPGSGVTLADPKLVTFVFGDR